MKNNVEIKTGCLQRYRFPLMAYIFILYQFISALGAFIVALVLPTYIRTILHYSDEETASLFHGKNALMYIFNIVGAIVADSYLGRAKSYMIFMPIDLFVLLGISIMSIYVLKTGIISLMFIISLLGGFIGPAVRALIPDQIPSDKKEMLSTFLHMIYLVNNIGALISSFVAPIIHKDIYCFKMECYPLNYFISLSLGIIAFLIVLICILTKKVVIHEATDHLLVNIFKTCTFAIKQRIKKGKPPPGKEWLDYSNDKFGIKFVNDVKTARNLCVFLAAHPLFWLVFEQMSSIWTLQAQQMNGQLTNNYEIKADQMQSINPFLVIILIPLFEALLYPFLTKIKFQVPYRIVAGQIFTALAALTMLFVQLSINNSLNLNIPKNHINYQLYSLNSNSHYKIDNKQVELIPHKKISLNIKTNENLSFYCNKTFIKNITYSNEYIEKSLSVIVNNKEPCDIIVNNINDPQINGGYANVSATNLISYRSFKLKLYGTYGINRNFVILPKYMNKGSYVKCGIGEFNLSLIDNTTNKEVYRTSVNLKPADTINFIILQNNNSNINVYKFVEIHFELISLFWQVIPYILLTIGEILFNVNNGIFIYDEAPMSMKAMMLAANYLCIGIGNFLIMSLNHVTDWIGKVYFNLLCALLTGLSAVFTGLLAYRYLKRKSIEKNKNVEFDINDENIITVM